MGVVEVVPKSGFYIDMYDLEVDINMQHTITRLYYLSIAQVCWCGLVIFPTVSPVGLNISKLYCITYICIYFRSM